MWVTSVAEVHNPDKFPRVRARGRSSVDQLALVDRSRRGWKPRLIDRSVSRIVHTEVRGGPAVALSRIPRSWFSATRPKPPAVISPSTRLSPLHLPQEPPPSRWKSRILCYPLSPTAVLARVRRLERYLSFSMCDPRPAPPPAAHPPPLRLLCIFLRSCVISTATVGTISSLNATSPAICLLCRAWQWNTLRARYNRAVRSFASVYFEKDRGSLRQVWSAFRVCISWNIFISHFISRSPRRWLDIYYFPFREKVSMYQ